MKNLSVCLMGALALIAVSGIAYAHCQIPCGIYDDELRFKQLAEHIVTLEKSIDQINELSANPSKNANQIVRWTLNKENHADEFAKIVVQYFLQQRIKPDVGDEKVYAEKLKLCHKLLVGTMKVKQTTDKEHTKALSKTLMSFHHAYVG